MKSLKINVSELSPYNAQIDINQQAQSNDNFFLSIIIQMNKLKDLVLELANVKAISWIRYQYIIELIRNRKWCTVKSPLKIWFSLCCSFFLQLNTKQQNAWYHPKKEKNNFIYQELESFWIELARALKTKNPYKVAIII